MNMKKNMNLHYKVVKQIGQGGRGIVNVCRNFDTNETFACKTIHKTARMIDNEQAVIMNEIDVHRHMSERSDKVAKLIDVYEDYDQVHILSEYLSGGNLESYCSYPERFVQGYIKQVLEALGDCHSSNVVHRDVKPGNFVRTSDDSSEIKMIDFGLSQRFAILPLSDLRVEGTTWYMAPECFRGECEPASDVWSTGVMAYFLMASKFPFSGRQSDMYSIVRDVLHKDPPFDSRIFSEVSQDFIRLLLEKKPSSRPTAKEALMHPWLKGVE